MPGTRTAPDVSDGLNVTGWDFQMRFLDYNNDKRSISLQFVGANSPAVELLEAVVVETQTLTNASIYECRLTAIYAGARSTSNALQAPRISVYDNIVVSFRDDAAREQFSGYIPAPVEAALTQSEQVNISNTDYLEWRNAMTTLFSTFQADRARFTERIERNPSGPA
jgi:hypothetical protein